MFEEFLHLSPYFFGYSLIIFVNVANRIVRNLVLPQEPDPDRRDALEAKCVYSVVMTGLVSTSLISWIFALAKVLAFLVSNPKPSLALLVVGAMVAFALLSWWMVTFITSIHPHSLGAKRSGFLKLKLTNASWARFLQLINITLGLIVDIIARHI